MLIQSHAISLFRCTMSDRVSVNHCVWLKLEELFQRTLKCNVHPLDGNGKVLFVKNSKRGTKLIISYWTVEDY